MLSMVSAYIAEFVGTFMLVFTVGCNALSKAPPAWAPTSVACTLMVMIYGFGTVSGGHLNPAVSLAAGLARKMPWSRVAGYVATQVGAGVAAGFCFTSLLWDGKVPLGPAAPFHWWQAMIVETLYTAMLAFVVLSVTSRRNNPERDSNQFFGLAIGFVVIAGGYGAGPISGGSFNPAVSLGLDVSSYRDGVYQGFVYSAYEAVGAALAAAVFRLTRPEDFGDACRTEGELAAYRPSLATRLASEFLGTFMLVLTVGLNVLAGSPATAWSAAASLMSMIYALGDVSGGHFNPSVTLAAVLSGRGGCSARDGAAYVAIQAAAGVLASLLYAGLHETTTFALGPRLNPSTGAPYPAPAAYLLEFLFTFVVALAVLSTACVKGITTELPRNYYFGLAIGSCVTAGGTAAGSVSGGSLNPAVSFGVSVADTLNLGRMHYCWAFCLAELAGGAAAAAVFRVTHAKEYREKVRSLRGPATWSTFHQIS